MKWLLAFITAFAVAALIMPLIIRLAKKLKMRQTVLHYVEEHKAKSGTPTMGGIGFILALAVSLFFSGSDKSLLLVALAVTVGYGIVGFLDDFIKVYFKRNDGLTPWQKIIFQLAIAVIVSIFAYTNGYVGGTVYSFFSFKEINLGLFAVPLYIFIFVMMTNSVNLTDGLDGLAGGVTAVYSLCFAAILYLSLPFLHGQAYGEAESLIAFCAALCGGLLGFLCYNGYPAKIFMGDTGSLALGGALACLAIFSRRVLLVPLLGVMYMLSSLSVIIQVLHYKRTKRRMFLMAPLHHHFQKKGYHESKIGLMYSVVTALSGAVIIVLIIALS